jgi:hypothetical protein
MKGLAGGGASAGGFLRSIAGALAAGTLIAGITLAGSATPAGATTTPTPTMTIVPSSGAVGVGGKIYATVTVTGVDNPSGSVIFTLFPPSDTGCVTLKKPLYTDTVTLKNGVAVSGTYTTTQLGEYTWVAYYSGDKNNASNSTTCSQGHVVVSKAVPGITTTPSGTVAAGGIVSDSAKFSAAKSPTGTATFILYGPGGPGDTSCNTAPYSTTTGTIKNGVANSGNVVVNDPGTYLWVVTYPGDANNLPASSQCGSETVLVQSATQIVTTVSSPTVALGGALSDIATLSGGTAPTGTITFHLYSNATCKGTQLFTSPITVSGNGAYTSGQFTPTSSGTYYWTASYSGDATNASSVEACGSANESSVVGKSGVALDTNASSSVTLGGSVSDSGTISGGTNPTGTITFGLFGPANPTCSGTAIFTSTVSVNNGNNVYPSGSFTPTVAGNYVWESSYSGDANNAPVAKQCAGEGEVVTVYGKPQIAVTKSASPTSLPAPGGNFTFTVQVSNPSTTVSVKITSLVDNIYGDLSTRAGSTCGVLIGTTLAPGATSGPCSFTGAFAGGGGATQTDTVTVDGVDTNGNIATSTAQATVSITKAVPAISTVATTQTPAGGAIDDIATLTGGSAPGGSISFTLFNNPTCSGTGTIISVVGVNGDGSYTSDETIPATAGTYYWIASYSGDANNSPVSDACGASNESSTVAKSTPTISTTASASNAAGGTVSDTATLSGGNTPTGTITFSLFGPNNSTCTGTAIFTSPITVNGNGSVTSNSYTTTASGTYQWVATYSGDANNSGITSPCGATGESTVVTKAAPSIATQVSAPVNFGGNISDSATISGGVSPTGTITFTFFQPGNPTCNGIASDTIVVNVAGNGTYSSGPVTPTAPGSYNWVAAYSGDANNAAVTEPCGSTGETSTVGKDTSTITTSATPTAAIGGTISDTATLSGAVVPGGTITFNVYGPSDPTCSAAVVFTSTATVTADGNYTSNNFTVTTAGTYHWIAAYSGDPDNTSASEPCGAANESTVVSKAATAVVTTATPVAGAGDVISDSATLSGGTAPTGIITFNLYGPNNATCTGTAIFTSPVAVTGNGTYASTGFTTTAAGTYNWVASYSGDGNNGSVSGTCGAAGETSTVTKELPFFSTTASGNVEVGGALTDTAFLASIVPPTGTITFSLFGPNNANCTGTAIFTSPVTVNGSGNFTSGSFTTSIPGTYQWVAAYSGNANNLAETDACGATGESTTVFPKPQISVSKSASPLTQPAPSGNFTFTVQVSNPSTIDPITITSLTDDVYGNLATLGGSTCGALIGTSLSPGASSAPCTFTGSFAGNAGASQTDTVTVLGTDPNTNTATATAQATVGLTQAATTVDTSPSGSVPAGAQISDSADIENGDNPTGTLTFTLYRANDTTCSKASIFTSTVAVTGDGTYNSAAFTTIGPGTYNWVVSYGGDVNNLGATSGCGLESVVVQPQTLTGESYAVGLNGTVLTLPVGPTYLQDTGPISETTNYTTPVPCLVNAALPDLLFTGDVCGGVTTFTTPGKSVARASVANVDVGFPSPAPVIDIRGVTSSSTTTCDGTTGNSTSTGLVHIAYLAVGGDVLIDQDTVIPTNDNISLLGGAVTLILNQETPFSDGEGDTGLTVNAINLTITIGLVDVNLIISSAQSDIGNCPGEGG